VRTLALLTAALALAALAACSDETKPRADGSTGADIATLFPASNAISGWTADAGGVKVYKTDAAAMGAVDGDADPFMKLKFTQFARLIYTNASVTADVRVWQMPDAATCATLFTSLASDSLYKPFTWEDTSVGEGGKIASASGKYWVYAHKGAYEFEAKVQAADEAAKTASLGFVNYIAGKIQ